jgi:hypothetical protein
MPMGGGARRDPHYHRRTVSYVQMGPPIQLLSALDCGGCESVVVLATI